jgi:hypothetical protein
MNTMDELQLSEGLTVSPSPTPTLIQRQLKLFLNGDNM